MDNEVEIHVTAKDDTKSTFAKIAESAKALKAKIKVEVDTDKDSFKGILTKFTTKLADSASGIVSSIQSTLGPIIGPALVAVIVPLIAGAMAAAIPLALGGGILVAGIIGAFQDPGVAKAGQELGNTLKSSFSKATESFIGPLKRSFDMIDRFVQGNTENFKKMFDTIAPLVEPLVRGFLRLAEEAMPGIQKGLEAAAPLFLTLAEKLPELGEALGEFFGAFSDQETMDAANDILTEIIDTIILFIHILGPALSWLARFGAKMRDAFYDGLDAVLTFKDGASDAISGFIGWVRNAVNRVGSAVSGMIAAFRRLPAGIRSGINSAISAAMGALGNLRSRVIGFFGSAGSWLYSAGRRIVQGIANGVRSMGGAIMSAVRSVIPDAVEGFIPGFAHGGIVGAASGGARSGLTMVGERGRELVKLPAGSHVYNSDQTERMLSGGGSGSQEVHVVLDIRGGDSEMQSMISKWFRTGQLPVPARAVTA